MAQQAGDLAQFVGAEAGCVVRLLLTAKGRAEASGDDGLVDQLEARQYLALEGPRTGARESRGNR